MFLKTSCCCLPNPCTIIPLSSGQGSSPLFSKKLSESAFASGVSAKPFLFPFFSLALTFFISSSIIFLIFSSNSFATCCCFCNSFLKWLSDSFSFLISFFFIPFLPFQFFYFHLFRCYKYFFILFVFL